MSTAPHTPLQPWAPPRPRLLHALIGAVVCGALLATYSVAVLTGSHGHHATTRPTTAPRAAAQPIELPPSATEFATALVSAANAYASDQGRALRLGHADCVQASRGHYMCSYDTRAPGRKAACHIIQARWTPRAESTITVTLSTRAARCTSLRDALRSLR